MKIKRELVKEAMESLYISPQGPGSLYFDPVALKENHTLLVMNSDGVSLGELLEILGEDNETIKQKMTYDELLELLNMMFYASKFFEAKGHGLARQAEDFLKNLEAASLRKRTDKEG